MAKQSANNFLLLFRGGMDPAEMTPEQRQATMNNWMTWMKWLKKRKQLMLGDPLQAGGKMLSGAKGKTVITFADSPDTVGGYMLIKAKTLAEATKIAQACPIFNNGGTVELRAVDQM